MVCQDFIASNTEDALMPDFYADTPDELPATPPPTAVGAGGNDVTFCFTWLHYIIICPLKMMSQQPYCCSWFIHLHILSLTVRNK